MFACNGDYGDGYRHKNANCHAVVLFPAFRLLNRLSFRRFKSRLLRQGSSRLGHATVAAKTRLAMRLEPIFVVAAEVSRESHTFFVVRE